MAREPFRRTRPEDPFAITASKVRSSVYLQIDCVLRHVRLLGQEERGS